MPVSNNSILDFEFKTGSSVWLADFPSLEGTKNTMANTTKIMHLLYWNSSSPLSNAAKQFISKLKSFESLEPNWDTYGALTPSAHAISRAVELVRKADRNLLPVYFVAPGPNGEVVVEFRRGHKEAAVYFRDDNSTELILNEGNDFVLEGTLEHNYEDLLTFINE